MKTTYTVIITLLFTTLSFSQNGINYKALIKDDLGNIISNEPVEVQFRILEEFIENGEIMYNSIFWEGHSTTTDINGIIILNIGEGNLFSDVGFSNLDWSKPNLSFLVNIETDNGSIISNINRFKTVPYALNAANVNGLQIVTEQDQFGGEYSGWRLIGRDANNHAPIGLGALDLSFSDEPSETNGAYGFYSLSVGFNTSSFGNQSQAFGIGTQSQSLVGASFGRYNTGGGSEFNWIESDPLFEIGNGLDTDNRSNAITILKNGTVLAPSFDLAEITDDKALITKEYLDINGSSGLEAINEGNGIGWRLVGRDNTNYGNIGVNAIDFSDQTFSDAYGAVGEGSFASGINTHAPGRYSFVTGGANISEGDYSSALGSFNNAIGDYSTAIGNGLLSNSFSQTTLGQYNLNLGGSVNSWVPSQPLFVIGNGENESSRSNALTVLKNGNIGINTVNPQYNLQIFGTLGFITTNIRDDGFRLRISNGNTNLYALGTASDYDFFPYVGNAQLGNTAFRWNQIWSVNPLNTSSDRRLKKEITPLKYGLETVLNLKPVSYKWKEGKQDTKLGFIAQDVETIIPEIVKQEKISSDQLNQMLESGHKAPNQSYYAMSYTELIPILTKAIQEQQLEIDRLKQQLENTKSMEERISALEQKFNN